MTSINFVCPINGTSYGMTSKSIIRALSEQKHEVCLYPIHEDPSYSDDLIRECKKRAQLDGFHSPSIRIWHQHDMAMFPISKGPKIGFPIFELDAFNTVERCQLQLPDMLFVCSNWAKNVLLDNFPRFDTDDVRVVPLGHDPEVFNTTGLTKVYNNDKFVFLNIGKWEVRKGHDFLWKAFQTAFPRERDVELWMFPSNPFLTPQEEMNWHLQYKDSRMKIFPRFQSHERVAEVMRRADCGVFPSRAEGWNLEAIEMLACGKQIIITDCTAHTEYIKEPACVKIPAEHKIPAIDNKWFFGQGNWHEPDFDALVAAMQQQYKKGRTNEFSEEAVSLAQAYKWSDTANAIIEHLK